MSDRWNTVYVVGAAAISAFGFEWRGLGAAVATAERPFAPSLQLAASHGEVPASEVPAIPTTLDVEARALKLMSHPARLAAVALRQVLVDAAWPHDVLAETALYMGVGASGAAMGELDAMLGASIEEHAFSLQRFGGPGLAACNPLFAFQLMNNFTLCHGAIASGVGGPNGAFFSRGTGTVAALSEAHWTLASGASERALAGGADSALHPVTWATLKRDGRVDGGLVPADGAALLALACKPEGALARIAHVGFHAAAAWRHAPAAVLKEWVVAAQAQDADLVVLAGWGAAPRELLAQVVRSQCPMATVIDLSAALGEALAATPALAWVVALDGLQQSTHRRALVLTAGIDGGIGLVVLERAE